MIISEDLLVEILLRCPLKTLAIFLCVSKLCASIIRSPRFIKAYQSRSTTRQPHVMFALPDTFTLGGWHYFSLYQPSLVTNGTCCVDVTSFEPVCVNGLICVEYMFRLWICNPVTRKVVRLPQSFPVKPERTWRMGYDPINHQYKVLFFSKYFEAPYKMEVFTLGSHSWKMIEAENIHAPATRSVCIDGVVYYGAQTADGRRLVRFDVATETFGDLVEIPIQASHIFYDLYSELCNVVNYLGKLALLVPRNNTIYDLWVLEDAEKQEWSKVSLVITREICSYDLVWLGMLGFDAGSGELIVKARDGFYQLYLVYVDFKMKRSRVVWLGGIRCSYQSSLVLAFTDYVESIMLF